jgi:hypothetical protein
LATARALGRRGCACRICTWCRLSPRGLGKHRPSPCGGSKREANRGSSLPGNLETQKRAIFITDNKIKVNYNCLSDPEKKVGLKFSLRFHHCLGQTGYQFTQGGGGIRGQTGASPRLRPAAALWQISVASRWVLRWKGRATERGWSGAQLGLA